MENGLRCAVFGASGGIGAALVSQLAARSDVAEVHALARKPLQTGAKVHTHTFDLADEATIAAACATIGGPLDLVIVATGRLIRDNGDGPEKSWRALNADAMAEMFAINAIGPALIGKHCAPLLRKGGKPVFAAISAKVGSIADNRLGGWHSYRASKAALNMMVRNFAIELGRSNPAAIAVTMHPGTVDTPLSRPFQRNVPTEKLFTAEQSATYLLGVIDGLTPTDTGTLKSWDGSTLPF
ncbi:SDR family NAD(P)-dependent oxidoreductase [Novosphingobium sp.]|uniref:SDR family NAD(P)-dependent oxidoreductase n=1 Tax=Novosphingobium sp. TaxID=1874826 RepID=UPI003562CE49